VRILELPYKLIINLLKSAQTPLAPERVFAFFGRRFAKHEVTLCVDATLGHYIEIKGQGPFPNARIYIDWETSNDLISNLKKEVP